MVMQLRNSRWLGGAMFMMVLAVLFLVTQGALVPGVALAQDAAAGEGASAAGGAVGQTRFVIIWAVAFIGSLIALGFAFMFFKCQEQLCRVNEQIAADSCNHLWLLPVQRL